MNPKAMFILAVCALSAIGAVAVALPTTQWAVLEVQDGSKWLGCLFAVFALIAWAEAIALICLFTITMTTYQP